MALSINEYEFAEVSIIGDENSALVPCYGEDLRIEKARPVVDRNGSGIVTMSAQMVGKLSIRVLIEQKPHTFAG